MGLSSGNSLTPVGAGGGSSGISLAQLKANTPWQFIAKLTANSSTELEYTSLTTDFQTFRIMYEDLSFTQNSHVHMQLYLDGTLVTSNYHTAGQASVGGSSQMVSNNNNYWEITDIYESGDSGGGRHLMGYTDFGCNNTSSPKHMLSNTTSSQSNQPTVYRLGGYMSTGSGSLITGFKLICASGNWSKGSIKIYGMN